MEQLVSPSSQEWLRWFIQFSIPALFLLVIVLFTAAARSGKYILKCILAPAIAVLGLFIVWLGFALSEKFPKSTLLEPATRGAAILVLVAALVCAILGLIEYVKTPKRSAKRAGGRYAVVTALFCTLAMGSLMISYYTKRTYGQGNFIKVFSSPRRIRFMEEKFQFTPPKGWVRVEGNHIKPLPALAFTNINPPLSFAVIVQKPGPESPTSIEALVELAQKQVLAANTKARFTKPLFGTDAVGSSAIFESQVSQTVFNFHYVHRLVLSQGFAYQLITWGPSSDPNSVRAASELMNASFALIR